ncbi:calcium-independent phospholipase A2-gamma-like, partial [Anableps anableps]
CYREEASMASLGAAYHIRTRMGCPFCPVLCSNAVKRTFISCRIMYTITCLKRNQSVVRLPLCLNSCRLYAFTGNVKLCTSSASSIFFQKIPKEVRHLRCLCFYSSTNKEAFKAEAPVEIFDVLALRSHPGQSFNPLSRHFNIYLKRRNVVGFGENGSFIATVTEYQCQSHRRRLSQWSAADQNKQGDSNIAQSLKCKEKQEKSEPMASSNEKSGLQLFHISSLTTTFGESYSYVAKHINSVFSQGYKVQKQETFQGLSSVRGASQRVKRKKIPNSNEMSEIKLNEEQTTVEHNNISNSWKEAYPHIARHINKYFGAKAANEAHNDKEHPEENNNLNKKDVSAKSTSEIDSGTASPLNQEEYTSREMPNLYLSSSHASKLGDNYFQTSSYINQYFRSKSGLKDHNRIAITKMDLTSSKTTSMMDVLRQPSRIIPGLLSGILNLGHLSQDTDSKTAVTSPEAIINNRLDLTHRQAEETAHKLIIRLGQASNPEALNACIDVLNEHLICFPSCKALIWQGKSVVNLLRIRRTYKNDQRLQAALREALALIGYVDPVRGCGIRVLSIDGGGTRGVVPLQLLKLLEDETGKKIHQLFDYMCGVSTGAILAFTLGLARFSLEECADMYRRFGSEVFRQNPLVGTVQMGWSHSYYNTATWERILQEMLGYGLLIKTSRYEFSPKVSAVSAVVNWGTGPKAFVFRNYNHKPGCLSRYAGGSGHMMWQAVRASSAAPGYFQEFPLQNDIHQDGGIILNNPCALAVHESRLLWPNQPFQCVLSLGTGRYDSVRRGPSTSTSLRAKISNLISSATDTEGVHTLLDELLPPDVYFRFNPMLNAEVSLDESRPGTLDQLVTDTQDYLERNRSKVAKLCLVLGTERSPVGRARDWISERTWEIKHRLM